MSMPPTSFDSTSTEPGKVKDETADQAQQKAGEWTAQAKDVVGQAHDQAVQAAATWTQQARDAASQATDQAQQTAGRWKGQAGETANQAKDQVQQTVRQWTDQAGDEARARLSEHQDRTADIASEAAGRLDHFSDYLRASSPDRVMRDVQAFARRRPGMVIAAVVVLGLLLSRLFGSSGRRNG